MNVNRFKDPGNVVYTSINDFVSAFAKEMGIPDLEAQITAFRKMPKSEGKIIKGKKRITIKILIPKLVLNERLDRDENIWVYLGESYPSYCLCDTEPWRDKNYSFFRHEKCEYFPCHQTGSSEEFNCLFCYCPLYPLKDRCGGNFTYYGNVKDCSNCTLPHQKKNYGYILSRFAEIVEESKSSV